MKVVHVIDRYPPRPTYLGKRDLLGVAEHHVCCVGGPRAVLPHQTSQHERVEHDQEDERDDSHEDQVHPDAVNLKESGCQRKNLILSRFLVFCVRARKGWVV